MRRLILLAGLMLAGLTPLARAQTITVEVAGRSHRLDAAALAALPATSTTVTTRRATPVTFTGPLLWAVLEAGGAAADYRAAARLALLVTASDGFTAVFSLGEISPELGARRVILALSADDPSITAYPRLVVPGEGPGARQPRDVVRLSVLPLRAP